MSYEDAVRAIRLEPNDTIPNWEFISNPEYEHSITGIEPFQHPHTFCLRMVERLVFPVQQIFHVAPVEFRIRALSGDSCTVS
jgi:hypothetical protein